MSHEAVKFEDIIANAEVHRQAAEKERRLAEEAQEEIQRMRRETEKKYLKSARSNSWPDRRQGDEAKRILEKAKAGKAAVLEELKAMKANDPAAINRLRKRMRDAEDELIDTIPGLERGESLNEEDLKSACRCCWTNRAPATLLSLPDAKGEVRCRLAPSKCGCQLTSCCQRPGRRRKKDRGARLNRRQSAQRQMECDVRGMALDEAISEVDNYLDNAVLAGYHEVSIIHGKGHKHPAQRAAQPLEPPSPAVRAPFRALWRRGGRGHCGDLEVTRGKRFTDHSTSDPSSPSLFHVYC